MNPEPIWDWPSSVQFLGWYRVEGESSKFRNSVGYITAMNALQCNCYGNGRNYGEAQKDCQWIADLLQHGLLRGSFVPPSPIRQLRDFTRTRASLRQDHTAVANRLQKILEDANIKLASVACDWLGVSGRIILNQMLDGEEDSGKLAHLCRGRLREKIPEMQLALEGRMTEHHRWMLRLPREQLEFLEAQIANLDARIQEHMNDLQKTVDRCTTIPGIEAIAAANEHGSVSFCPTSRQLGRSLPGK